MKNPISMFYRKVFDFDTVQLADIHVRASRSREKRVYLYIPAEMTGGVYLDMGNSTGLRDALTNAIKDAKKGLERQVIEVVDTTGTITEVEVPAGITVSQVRVASKRG